MDSTLVIKNSYTYCKNLEIIKAKYYAHAPRGIDWYEKTIARPRLPLITMTIKEHLMFQIVTQRLPYVHATRLANFNTSIYQIHKYSTIMTNITIFISQNNHKESNFS